MAELVDYGRAIEENESAIELDPEKFAWANADCGVVYGWLGQLDRAAEDHQRALAEAPNAAAMDPELVERRLRALGELLDPLIEAPVVESRAGAWRPGRAA